MSKKAKSIGIFKVQKVENSMVIPIPKSLSVKEGDLFTLSVNASKTRLTYEKTRNTNPWENGQFSNFNFRKNMREIGFDDQGKNVGKERNDRS